MTSSETRRGRPGQRNKPNARRLIPTAASVLASSVPTGSPYQHIEPIVLGGGQTMISTVQTIRGTAVAHDSVKTLVMLRCKPAEPLPELLARLDLAIATAQFTGKRVDEINRPAVNTTDEN